MSLYALAGMLLANACSADDLALQTPKPLMLTATSETPVPTRAATNIQSSAFEYGQTIYAYISYLEDSQQKWIGNPTTYTTAAPQATTDGGYINALTPTQQPYFPASNPLVNIYALYPQTGVSITDAGNIFSVQADQTSDDGYRSSDLMHAMVTNQQTTDLAINLPFTHKMAKIIVNAKSTEDVHIRSIVLRQLYRTIGFTPSTGELGTNTTLTDSIGGITIYRNDSGSEDVTSAALFPPQSIMGDFIEVYTDKGVAKFSVTTKTFESGKEYTINLTIGRQAIGFTSTITDWSTDIGTMAITVQSNAQFKITDDVDSETFIYTGNPIEPDAGNGVKVAFGTTPSGAPNYLTYGTDYTLEYFNNTNAGTATIIAVGMGSYASQAAVKSFIIQQREVELKFTDQPTKSVTYVENGNVNNLLTITTTDSEHKNILLGSMGLGHITYTSSMQGVATINEGGDITIHGEGTTTIEASMSSEGNYVANSTTPASFALTVTKKPLSELSISVTTPTTPCYYTGSAIKPTITIEDTESRRGLTENQDYTISLSNNTNAGTAEVVITGTGSYTGTYSTTFTIQQAPNTLTIASTAQATIPVGTTLNRPATSNFGVVKYSSNNESCAPVSAAGVVSGLASTSTPATITVSVDETTNYKGATLSYQVVVMNTEWEFEYKGAVEEWTAPVAGNYRLEVYGAQGGSINYSTTWWGRTYTQTYSGGQGGYATGTVSLTAGQTLYICVGGAGQGGNADGTSANGGYNGGGGGGSGSSYGGSGGGGCTHIAKATGERSTLAIGNIYLIAGGGGGSGYGATGAAGGGTSGGRGQKGNRNVDAATQSSGQSGGVGQTGANATGGWGGGNYGSGGGGGGYYGGPANTDGSQRGSGSGGSGYTDGVSSGTMRNGTRQGDGYAKITYLP